jgi:hypothetical protein
VFTVSANGTTSPVPLRTSPTASHRVLVGHDTAESSGSNAGPVGPLAGLGRICQRNPSHASTSVWDTPGW